MQEHENLLVQIKPAKKQLKGGPDLTALFPDQSIYATQMQPINKSNPQHLSLFFFKAVSQNQPKKKHKPEGRKSTKKCFRVFETVFSSFLFFSVWGGWVGVVWSVREIMILVCCGFGSATPNPREVVEVMVLDPELL